MLMTACPDCGEEIPKRAKSCPCGWRPSAQNLDYEAKLAALRRDPSKTRIPIGDRYTWVTACSFVTSSRRCRMAASVGDFCAWHSWAVQDPRFCDRAEFERWLKVSERWHGDPDILWRRVMGYDL